MSQAPPVADGSQFNPHTGMMEPTTAKLAQLLLSESGALAQAHAAAGKKGAGAAGCPFLQLQNGMCYMDDDNSLKAGVRGGTFLEDQILREKINHFDHERIPERVVHARGTGAHGHFRVYESLADITRASLFQDPSKSTPVFVRFSTVAGSRGSADTVRDVRGFATKFYTETGNWDLVGNDIPVFFVQDAMKFPDLVHAAKPEPQTEMPQAQTAHDNFWDFVSWSPETLHTVAWAMSDRGIPRSYRMMQGFGVHTFAMVNAKNERSFVKFHWKPLLGVHGLAWDECLKLNGVDPDFHRRDLYEAISGGNFPEYELGIQVVPEKDEESFDFDLLDATKIIPEELVPIRWVGRMVLDRMPADFFAEVEQIAFCTQNIVDGIDFTNDPLLQGRNFSYLDTQLSRLGSVNFNQIPINRPLVQPQNHQRDGHMQMEIKTDKLNYFPNRNSAKALSARPGNGGETQGELHAKGAAAAHRAHLFESYAARVEGMKVRAKAPKFLERFNQVTLFINSLTAPEKAHVLAAMSFELSKVLDLGVRQRLVALWNEVDHDMAVQLANNIAVAPPGAPSKPNHGKSSKFLSMVASPYSPPITCATRKIACLVADGYRAEEIVAAKTALEKEGAMLVLVGVRMGRIYAEGQAVVPPSAQAPSDPVSDKPDPTAKEVQPPFTLANCKSVLFDGLMLVGGEKNVKTLENNGAALSFICETLKHCKAVAACSEAVRMLLYPAGVAGIRISQGSKDPSAAASSSGGDGSLVEDDGVVTLASPLTGEAGGKLLELFIGALKQHRCWTRKGVDKIPA